MTMELSKKQSRIFSFGQNFRQNLMIKIDVPEVCVKFARRLL